MLHPNRSRSPYEDGTEPMTVVVSGATLVAMPKLNNITAGKKLVQ